MFGRGGAPNATRKSNTKEADATKKKLVDLQIYKMKTKLLCEEVFVSFKSSANDLIAERDATTASCTFDDYSGNTQDLRTIRGDQNDFKLLNKDVMMARSDRF